MEAAHITYDSFPQLCSGINSDITFLQPVSGIMVVKTTPQDFKELHPRNITGVTIKGTGRATIVDFKYDPINSLDSDKESYEAWEPDTLEKVWEKICEELDRIS